MSLEFDLRRLADKIYETFSHDYHTEEKVKRTVEDLKRKKECLDKDPYCSEVFEELIVAVVTQGYYFKRFDEKLRIGLRKLTSKYGVRGLLEGKGREELLRFIKNSVNERVLTRTKALVKVRYVLDSLKCITLREWVKIELKDFKGDLTEQGLRLLGDKGLNDFLKTAGCWDKVPIDINEQRFIIRTGIYLAHPEPQKFDPTDKSFLREALKTFASKYLKDKTIAGIDLGENPGVLDAFIYTYCSSREGLGICAREPKCNKEKPCKIREACLHFILTTSHIRG